ncbi:MAG: glutathione peroxidase [Bacteroidales bacterium]|nr:glutathione peroxidase [Bacteroidales bacterium]
MAMIYDYKAQTSANKELDFAQFRGKVLLIVNTATKCGLSGQFNGLEELHKKYKEDGLVLIGFPCNQFANQEPGNDEQVAQTCQVNFGVTFQIMKKIDVNGENAHPIFKYLKSQTKGFLGSKIKWNFTKFLISRDGKTIKRYAPTTSPAKVEADIKEMLGK